MPKLWMGGVGSLCAIAHYRAALLAYNSIDQILLVITFETKFKD